LTAASATFVLKVGPAQSSVVSPVNSVFSAFGQKCHLSEPALYTRVGLIVSIPRQFSANTLHVGKSGMVVVLIFGNSPQSKWRILIRSMIGSNSSKDAAALRQTSGAPTWGAWTMVPSNGCPGHKTSLQPKTQTRQGLWN
jgi:hypothetical protein